MIVAGLLLACGTEPAATPPAAAVDAVPSSRPEPDARAAASPAARSRTIGELEARRQPRPPVVLVALDGADWQHLGPLIAAGALPNLARLRAQGAWGALETEVPALSPLLWTTMMTGVSPLEHGVLDFGRFRPGSGLREPITSDERRAPAIWNAATWAGLRVNVLGLWATHPPEPVEGVLVSDRFFGFLNVEQAPPAGAVFPPAREAWAAATAARAWRTIDYEAVAAYLPGLEEPEYRAHAETARPYDHPISALRRILVETRLYGDLAEALVAEDPAADLTIVYLQGTDSIGHVFAPYAPPRQPSIPAADFERYRGVSERYFREVDAWLGRLAAAARDQGAILVVVSDHGFLWGEGRPERLSSIAHASAARWHRREGIWMVAGAGLAPGRGPNAGLRQVYPTLLALLGLPAAAGVESRPLGGVAVPATPAFDYARAFRALTARRDAELSRRAPALTGSGLATGSGPEPDAASEPAALEEIAKLQALGYLGAGEVARAPAAVVASGSTRTAGSYNNAGILLRGEHRDAEARAAFERALELEPGLASAAWNLSEMLFAAGELERADQLLVRALAGGLPEGVRSLVARAIGYQRAGRLDRSLALVDGAVAARPEETELWLFRGRYRVEAGNCRGAADDFERAARLAPGNAATHSSLALAYLCLGDRSAADAALRRSLELDPDQPRVRALLAGGEAR